MPACLGTSMSVRANSMPQSAESAEEFHTFWPVTTHSSPSRTARVPMLARSDPEPGSLKSWHQAASPVAIGPHQLDLLGLGGVLEQGWRGQVGCQVTRRWPDDAVRAPARR